MIDIMIDIKYRLIAVICCFILSSCATHTDVVFNHTPLQIYSSAQKKLKKGNYIAAIQDLKQLEQDSIFNHAVKAKKVQIDLMYAYYKSGNFSTVTIDSFLKMNPTHPHVDYVLYLRGLSNMEMHSGGVDGFFGLRVASNSCNLEYARAAFCDFKQLVVHHPNSKYSMDASKRLIYLKNWLANYELSVVKYYDRREAYIAVVNRVEKMLSDFPDTQATRKAIPYMEWAYRQLQLSVLADTVHKIQVANPIQ
ncbi:outer membrane assembly lipoprotein YfiO [secondary endosymbiont of Heteropsylla cubana]|uniref:Outer membrane protein assembly factor BamD n=1 Tax=secondary endosymbiont of Heteropsylla cubana TaxID=134287 RepID=J3TG54_9ENTR|nr:outer membrane protein assembly factor BamD [secondary endosymbiont of Heteropsylla cubana]AFP85347.1 outer membrane assembly lipoprotein YfiO [secondary endosymbiont of Heteropsylla cubana]